MGHKIDLIKLRKTKDSRRFIKDDIKSLVSCIFLFKKPISDKRGQNMGSNDGHAVSYSRRKTTFASDKADHGVRGRGRSPDGYQVFKN